MDLKDTEKLQEVLHSKGKVIMHACMYIKHTTLPCRVLARPMGIDKLQYMVI